MKNFIAQLVVYLASFGTFLSRMLPYTAYRCTVSFSSNNPQTLLFAVAMNKDHLPPVISLGDVKEAARKSGLIK